MAQRNHFNKAELQKTLHQIRYVKSAVQLVKPAPPGQPKNWRAYRARFIEPIRINAGVAFWDTYAAALQRAEIEYGVPPEIIVGLIGIETVYGRNTGNFRVMDALATLAFAYPETPNRVARMAYFRSELENALLFARDSNIDPYSLLGSYAGAIGWPQFMPGSILKYAVDFDGDGKISLRTSPIDAIGSIANYLAQHGWKRGEPLVFPVALPPQQSTDDRWKKLLGESLSAQFTLDQIKAAGVMPVVEPPPGLLFTLVDLQNAFEPTEYWIGTSNFFAITQYNRSYFYAMSVLELGRSVKAVRALE